MTAQDLGNDDVSHDLARGDGLLSDGAPSAACRPSAALLARIDATRMLTDLQQLVGLGERSSHAGQSQAAAYLKSELSKLSGLTVREQSYQLGGQGYVNLEVTIAGAEKADQLVAMGAHYDSASESATVAPGADDNASGTVAVLEAARVLAGCHPARSVRLLFFSNEERGMVGSQVYVAAIKPTLAPQDLVGFLSVDMVGFGPQGEDLDLASRPPYAALVDATAAAVTQWSSLSVKKIINEHCG